MFEDRSEIGRHLERMDDMQLKGQRNKEKKQTDEISSRSWCGVEVV